MTRLALLSDIHANLPALEAVVRGHRPPGARRGVRPRRPGQRLRLAGRDARPAGRSRLADADRQPRRCGAAARHAADGAALCRPASTTPPSGGRANASRPAPGAAPEAARRTEPCVRLGPRRSACCTGCPATSSPASGPTRREDWAAAPPGRDRRADGRRTATRTSRWCGTFGPVAGDQQRFRRRALRRRSAGQLRADGRDAARAGT